MHNKERRKKIKLWNKYFRQKLKIGLSWQNIRNHLIIRKGYPSRIIELLIYNYRLEAERALKAQKTWAVFILGIFILVLFVTPLILQRPTITGLLIGGPEEMPVEYYVSMSGSDSSTTGNITNPFLTFTKGLNTIRNGDTLIVREGTYIEANGYTFKDKVLTKKTTIKGYPGETAIITAYTPGWEAANTNWEKISSGSINLWKASFVTSSNELYVMEVSNNKTWLMYSNWNTFLNTSRPRGFYYNGTANQLYLKTNDSTMNPNNMGFYIGSRVVLTIRNTTGAELEISNLTFTHGIKGISLSSNNNITIKGNKIKGGHDGIMITSQRNSRIINNELTLVRESEWDRDTAYYSLFHGFGILVSSVFSNVNISNNKIVGYYNGIGTFTSTRHKNTFIEVGYNNLSDIGDDAFEIEMYCDGGHFHHNIINNSLVAFSIAPADCSGQNTTVIEYNIMIPNKYELFYLPKTRYYGECFKLIDTSNSHKTVNFNITHNTCYGIGIYTTYNYNRTQYDVNWRNNIFASVKEAVCAKCGLASDGVSYDYNLYHRNIGDDLFKYWNSDTNTSLFNLSQALASSLWDGKWDVHSIQADPLFVDAANGDFRLRIGSPACTMSSTGSYVGALPCESTPEPPAPFCGDGSCNGLENCSTCSSDCGSCPIVQYCGDGNCSSNENCSTCSSDCGSCPIVPFCGDGSCNGAENCSTCSLDCGNCSAAPFCGDSSCNNNENCSTCSNDCGTCPITAYCGDSTCNDDENCSSCAADCGSCPIIPYCGDLTCNDNENCSTCVADCGICPEIQAPERSSGGGGGSSRLLSNKSTNSTAKGNAVGKASAETNTTKESNLKVKQEASEEITAEEGSVKKPDLESAGEIRVVSQTKDNTIWTVIMSILIGIALIGVIASVNSLSPVIRAYLKNRKTAARAEEPKDLKREEVENNIGCVLKLHTYVKEAAKLGYTRERVRSELLGVGWERGIVEPLLLMHESEFLPPLLPEPPVTQSLDAQKQPKGAYMLNPVEKWLEFEKIDYKEE